MNQYIVDNEIAAFGQSIKQYSDFLAETTESYISALDYIHTYAITGNDLIRPKIEGLLSQVSGLPLAIQEIGKAGQDLCNAYIRQIEEDDSFLYGEG
ncbi:MAG: hypothetical protein LBS58_05405 [Coriobacteriales bacterium]|jgi:hypothetical protein|nr:hypothetical protein [Coriobacteriales bacterium]